MCKDCAAKLSPWISRKEMTVAQINEHLAYREENAAKLPAFKESRVIGSNWSVHFDDTNGLLYVSRGKESNPDLIPYSQITGCSIDIDESKRTETINNGAGGPGMQGGPGGQRPGMQGGFANQRPGMGMQNQRPGMGGPGGQRPGMGGPQGGTMQITKYFYDVNVIIHVNNPWFSTMEFQVNSSSIEGQQSAAYLNAVNEANSIQAALQALNQANVENIAAAAAPKTAMVCPHCGASTIPNASGCCEFCGGACN